MVEESDYPLRFRRSIYPNTDSPYDSEFVALREYNTFNRILSSSGRFRKLVTDENRYRHHCYDAGC